MKITKTYDKQSKITQKKQRRLRRISAIAAAGILSVLIGTMVASAYDSSSDPLISLSYVENVLKPEIEKSFLSNLGYSSFSQLKNAINSGGSVDESAIVNKAKSSILSELGFQSYATLKNAIINGMTDNEKSKLNTYVQSSILSQLGLNSMAELKAKLNDAGQEVDIVELAEKIKLDLLNELGHSSMSSLKADLEKINEENEDYFSNKAIDELLKSLGYTSFDDLKKDIDKINAIEFESGNIVITNDYKALELERGDKLITNGNCEIIVASGTAALIGDFGSAVVSDMTGGSLLTTGELMENNHNTLVPVSNNGDAVVVVSSEACIYIRGQYEIG